MHKYSVATIFKYIRVRGISYSTTQKGRNY
nr:MAG TPA: hypothetical protein [Caudoviricetes sp.]